MRHARFRVADLGVSPPLAFKTKYKPDSHFHLSQNARPE